MVRVAVVLVALVPSVASLAGGFGKAPAKTAAKAKKSFEGKKTFERQMQSWNALHEDEKPAIVDVYVRAEGAERFWFVGKSAARQDACDDAAARSAVVQKRLVLEHSKLLQMELRTARALTLWCAPGNSEVAVARKQQGLRPLDGLQGVREQLAMSECGFLPEQYEKANGEKESGFYVRLPPDGQPDEGDEGADVKMVTADQLEEMRISGEWAGLAD